ncbi:unnamed protein product [Rhizophagus irregularis]|nr:unnamed protein product [Rhizophagus irregularis]
MYHFLKRYIFQNNFSSPIEDKLTEGGCKILDIGCADVTIGLSFHDNEFDFTHVENMDLVFAPDQWDFVLSELIRITKPDAFWTYFLKGNIETDLMYNLDSKFELQQNIGEVHRVEKDLIIGPNGDKTGISEEEYKNMIEKDLIEEFKQTSPKIFHFRLWVQKQLSQ